MKGCAAASNNNFPMIRFLHNVGLQKWMLMQVYCAKVGRIKMSAFWVSRQPVRVWHSVCPSVQGFLTPQRKKWPFYLALSTPSSSFPSAQAIQAPEKWKTFPPSYYVFPSSRCSSDAFSSAKHARSMCNMLMEAYVAWNIFLSKLENQILSCWGMVKVSQYSICHNIRTFYSTFGWIVVC